MENSKSPVVTPTVKRRLISLVYEAFLVTAVLMLGFLPFAAVSKSMDPALRTYLSQVVLFIVAGAYFVKCWTGSGHTLAMKTWRIKLVKVGYADVPLKTAVLRYVYAWGWVLPALVVCFVFDLKSKTQVPAVIAVGIIAWAMTAFLDKDRQFLHDKLAGTRLISLPKPVKAVKATGKTA